MTHNTHSQEDDMLALNSLEMLGFGIKLAGKHTRKNILLSAGNLKDKETLFPYIQKLSKLNVALFATPGTCRFLKARGVECGELHKIVDKREPNISSFLSNDKLDLVINILTGNSDYDEASDCKTIRSM